MQLWLHISISRHLCLDTTPDPIALVSAASIDTVPHSGHLHYGNWPASAGLRWTMEKCFLRAKDDLGHCETWWVLYREAVQT